MRAVMRGVYYLAIATLLTLFVWGQLTAKTWQEIAEQTGKAAVEAARRADGCLSELYEAKRGEEEGASTTQPE